MLIGIVPARGGSKGIPGKNLLRLNGKSLVRIAIDFASDNPLIDRVILSTDSTLIAKEVLAEDPSIFEEANEGEVINLNDRLSIHKRKTLHSQDNSRTIETILDIFLSVGTNDGDQIILLQPTSPFREQNEVAKLVSTTKENRTTSCVSARLMDSPHPSKAFELNEEFILELSDLYSLSRPRQELKPLFIFDGAYYLTDIKELKRTESLLSERTSIFLRKGISTLNIDNEDDYLIAKLFQRYKDEL